MPTELVNPNGVPILFDKGQQFACPKCGAIPPNDRPNHPACLELQVVSAPGQMAVYFGCMNCYVQFLLDNIPQLQPISEAALAIRNANGIDTREALERRSAATWDQDSSGQLPK